jgi:hypothetical protein
MRVWASTNISGTGARELTSGEIFGTSNLLSTTANTNSGITWNAPAITLTNEYLFFQLEFQEQTTAGSSNTDTALFRVGSSITTTNWSPIADGDLALSQAAQTLSAAGNSIVDGDLILPQAVQTLSAAGGPVVRGTLARTEIDDTLAATGTNGAAAGTILFYCPASVVLSNSNLTATKISGSGYATAYSQSTRGATKVYAEVHIDYFSTVIHLIGIGTTGESLTAYVGSSATSYGWNGGGNIYHSGTSGATVSSFTQGDWLAFALDRTGPIFQIRNITQGGAWSSSLSASGFDTTDACLGVSLYDNSNAATFNFDGTFLGTPPGSGYTRWDGSSISGAPGTITGTLNLIEADDTIAAAGGPIVEGHLGTVGASGTPTTVYDNSFDATDSGWGGETHPVKVAAGNLAAGSGTQVRLTLEFATFSAGATCKVYFGQQAASGDPQDFANTPAHVTFGGGNITADGSTLVYVSDWVDLPEAYDHTKNYIHCQYYGAGSISLRTTSAVGNDQWYSAAAIDDAATVDKLASNYLHWTAFKANLVRTIEVRGVAAPAGIVQADQTLAAAGSVGETTGISGGLTVIQANQTLVAAGVVTINGTLSVQQASQTLVAIGTVLVRGTLSAPQTNQTLVSVGGPVVSGALSTLQANQTIVSAGTVLVRGTLSAPQANQTLVSIGGPVVRGTLSAPQAAQTLSAGGSVISGISGTLNLLQASQTLSATGTVPVVCFGSLNLPQAAQTLAAAGSPIVSSTLSTPQANQTLVSVGKVTVSGVLNSIQVTQTIVSTGKVVVSGILSSVQESQSLQATGTVSIRGTLTVNQYSQTLLAAGAVYGTAIGTLRVTQQDQWITATGVAGVIKDYWISDSIPSPDIVIPPPYVPPPNIPWMSSEAPSYQPPLPPVTPPRQGWWSGSIP